MVIFPVLKLKSNPSVGSHMDCIWFVLLWRS